MGLIWKRALFQSAWSTHLTFMHDSRYNREVLIQCVYIFICHHHFNLYYDAFHLHINYRSRRRRRRKKEGDLLLLSFFSFHSSLFLIGCSIRFVMPPIVTILIIHSFRQRQERWRWVEEKEKREVLIRTLINLFYSDPECW